MNEEAKRIAERLRTEGDKTLDFFRQLDPAAWEQQVYTAGSCWRVHDVLAHFVSAEQGFHGLLEDVAAGGPGAPRDMDVDRFNESQVPRLSRLTAEELLKAFQQARAANVQLAAGLSEQDLDRIGYHPWLGEAQMRQMLKLLYRHNMIHLRDVRKALAAGRPVPHQEIEAPSRQKEGGGQP